MKESIGDKVRRAQFEKNDLRNDLVIHIPDTILSVEDLVKQDNEHFNKVWNDFEFCIFFGCSPKEYYEENIRIAKEKAYERLIMHGEGCENLKGYSSAGVDPFKENEEPSKAIYVSNSSISNSDMRKLRLKYYYGL